MVHHQPQQEQLIEGTGLLLLLRQLYLAPADLIVHIVYQHFGLPVHQQLSEEHGIDHQCCQQFQLLSQLSERKMWAQLIEELEQFLCIFLAPLQNRCMDGSLGKS
jgi:hypothetical protein